MRQTDILVVLYVCTGTCIWSFSTVVFLFFLLSVFCTLLRIKVYIYITVSIGVPIFSLVIWPTLCYLPYAMYRLRFKRRIFHSFTPFYAGGSRAVRRLPSKAVPIIDQLLRASFVDTWHFRRRVFITPTRASELQSVTVIHKRREKKDSRIDSED